MIKHYCDICKKEIKDTIYTMTVNPLDMTTIDLNRHLCKDCVIALDKVAKDLIDKLQKGQCDE